MKKICILLLSAVLTFAFVTLGVSANRTLPLVVDEADLLTSNEEASLEDVLDKITSDLEIEVAVVTVNSTDGQFIQEYADDFYDYNGYGYGIGDDGVMLLIDMGGREWHITTHGDGAYYLDDYSLYLIEEEFIEYLSDGDYFSAFAAFAYECEEQITSAKLVYEDTSVLSIIMGCIMTFALPSLIVGFIISLIVVSIMKSGMKTVRSANGAADYMVNGSLNLRSHSDRYLYSNTVRTRRDTSSHSGSSMHRSSSGRSHGGRGGRF